MKDDISEELLDLLVCPVDKAKLKYYKKAVLVCTKCALEYSINDGIPVLR